MFIVDDNRAVRKAMRDLIRKTSLRSRCSPIAKPSKGSDCPDRLGCLVIDRHMPGLDGIELLKRLEADDREHPAIVMSDHADVPTAVHAMRAGAVDVLEMPVCFDQLLAGIRRALNETGIDRRLQFRKEPRSALAV